MDALGAFAPEPDDDYLFNAIVADIDGDAIEQSATTPNPTPAQTSVESPQTPPPVPAPKADQEQAAAPTPTPTSAPVPAPTPVVEQVPLSQPVKPERPALVEPTEPMPPSLGRAEKTGHYASITGYAMSVGVGAFGQIMFLGTWLEATLPAPGNWLAALVGAAFAEIGMIGAGNSSLSKRRDGGRWKLLFAVACFVCVAAVIMQVAHWLPKGVGVALVFGLASFVGFLIHMTIEHSKIRDHEDRMARYKKKLTAYQAAEQARYEQDLAAYEAAAAEQQRQHRQIEQAAKKAEASAPSRLASATATKRTGGRAVKEDAVRIGVAKRASTPATLREALKAAGYTLPASSTTVENWCRVIKQQLANEGQ